MLMRLQGALGLSTLSELVLLSGNDQGIGNRCGDSDAINLVVGYDGSPKSHTALDLTLWIAHQTRLVTQAPVTVHAVHVVKPELDEYLCRFNSAWVNQQYFHNQQNPRTLLIETGSNCVTLTQSTLSLTVLQQACQLAKEWGGAFDTHLQFGNVATGLRTVVEAESSVLLFLGCCSAEHPIVQQLKPNLPCPVLGIPDHCNSMPS